MVVAIIQMGLMSGRPFWKWRYLHSKLHSTTSWSRYRRTFLKQTWRYFSHSSGGNAQNYFQDKSCTRLWRSIWWSWFSKTGPFKEGILQFPVTKEHSASLAQGKVALMSTYARKHSFYKAFCNRFNNCVNVLSIVVVLWLIVKIWKVNWVLCTSPFKQQLRSKWHRQSKAQSTSCLEYLTSCVLTGAGSNNFWNTLRMPTQLVLTSSQICWMMHIILSPPGAMTQAM